MACINKISKLSWLGRVSTPHVGYFEGPAEFSGFDLPRILANRLAFVRVGNILLGCLAAHRGVVLFRQLEFEDMAELLLCLHFLVHNCFLAAP